MFEKETYAMTGGRRGMGQVIFLQHLLAQRTAQLSIANSRIAELEKKLLRRDISDCISAESIRRAISQVRDK